MGMESSGQTDGGAGGGNDTTRAVHKSKVGAKLRGFSHAFRGVGLPNCYKINHFTLSSDEYHRAVPPPSARPNRLHALHKSCVPSKRLSRLLTSISVRTRIVVLALIPVVGFVANGLTYVSGEGDVGTAFDTVKHSAALADASRDFKSAIAAMRITVKDFAANPSDNLVMSFDAGQRSRCKASTPSSASIDRRNAENIASLRNDVTDLRD